jgi:geranylgeranyl diphosphate synthase type II
LYLKAQEFYTPEQREELLFRFSIQPLDTIDKVESVKKVFEKTGASDATQKAITDFTMKAFETLEKMEISEDKKSVLRLFGEKLMCRNVSLHCINFNRKPFGRRQKRKFGSKTNCAN